MLGNSGVFFRTWGLHQADQVAVCVANRRDELAATDVPDRLVFLRTGVT